MIPCTKKRQPKELSLVSNVSGTNVTVERYMGCVKSGRQILIFSQ